MTPRPDPVERPSGKEERDCPYCDGDGTVLLNAGDLTPQEGGPEPYWRECVTCGGTGHLSGRPAMANPVEHVYDTRTLTNDQRSLADDIASAMSYGHEVTCAVWWEEPDGCSCPLLQAVADGLDGARVVEVIQEWGYDPATQRGDRLHRQMFRPHPLLQESEPADG